MHAGGILGLDADDADLRVQRLHIGRDAADEAAAADRHEDRVGARGELLQDLEGDRALAGDDVGVVERMDEREPALGAERHRPLERRVVVVPGELDLAA